MNNTNRRSFMGVIAAGVAGAAVALGAKIGSVVAVPRFNGSQPDRQELDRIKQLVRDSNILWFDRYYGYNDWLWNRKDIPYGMRDVITCLAPWRCSPTSAEACKFLRLVDPLHPETFHRTAACEAREPRRTLRGPYSYQSRQTIAQQIVSAENPPEMTDVRLRDAIRYWQVRCRLGTFHVVDST